MPDDTSDTRDTEEKSFAEIMESYGNGRNESIRLGEKIRGKILSIGKDGVFVDTGTKIDGVVEKGELVDENGGLPYNVGDILELYVVSSRSDEIKLSKSASKSGGLQALRSAYENMVPVEGKVRGQVKGGFHVEVMKKRAFCPAGQMDLRFVADPVDHIGKGYLFRITQFEENGKNIVVSRRELLKEEQAKARQEFLKELKVGSELDGRITRVMPYGAFVEIFPGLEGMVHLSELSWSRVAKPEDLVRKDEVLRVKVLGIGQEGAEDRIRISLSAKQVTRDPWEDLGTRLHVGDRLKGKVTRCAKFGAFVEIAPGVEGLVHLSEMSYKKRVVKPEDIVTPGDIVEVMIKDLEPSKRRISLSIREAEGDPWSEVVERFHVGQTLGGTVEKKERFGFFVSLAPGITGLLPKSHLAESGAPGLSERIREGDTIRVVIEAIQPEERKMTLGLAQKGDEEENWHRFTGTGAKRGFGSLAEKLQLALKTKEDNTTD